MGRTGRDKRPYVKPVKKIELSNDNVKRRIIFVALFLVFGVFCIVQGVSHLMTVPAGWTEIKVEGASVKNSGSDFTFYYNLGQGDMSASDEKRALTNMYGVLCIDAYQMFDNYEEAEDKKNIYYINRHPNEEIEIDSVLYSAFEKNAKAKNRSIFLAPVYEYYNNIFFCENDSETVDYDPYQNEVIAAFYQEVTAFSNDETAVNVELLGENRIRLFVSDEYLKYAKENDISSFVDFGWMKNAYIADYIADSFVENGFGNGMISSYDGFSRVFVPDDERGSFNLNALYEDRIYPAASVNYSGSHSIVTLRSYEVIEKDKYNYFTFSNGDVRTPYIDTADGKCKSATPQLTMYSESKSCTDVLLEMTRIYVADVLDETMLEEVKTEEIYSIFFKDNVIYNNSKDIQLTDLYDKDGIKFTASFVE